MIPFQHPSGQQTHSQQTHSQQTRSQRRSAWIANHRSREQAGPKPAIASESQARPAVHVSIQNLQLHGFAALDRAALGRAVEVELTRLLVENGLPDDYQRPGSVDCLSAGGFPLAKVHRSSTIGMQIARTVYRGIENGGRP